MKAESLEAIERRHIENVLRAFDNNRTQAARILGVNRRTLQRKILQWKKGAKK